MDFYAGQDRARDRTLWLLGVFSLAVLLLVGLVNALVLGLFFGGEDAPPLSERLLSADSLMLALALVSVIVLVSLFRWLQLRQGGSAVAVALGGKLLSGNTATSEERRLLNVVEEMAIAAGTPVPEVYLLAQEHGINAFAAGHGPADAVIGVTKGTLVKLDRQQLQGVIAHEFSHILNGDMALNLRLMALLSGILCLHQAGRILLHAGRGRGKSSGQVALLGVGLWCLGGIGFFFAQLIKAAISRQREYLADASAVQFTRSPDGIADALKLIAADGSALVHPGAGEASHLFFGNAQHSDWFATHPPLERRIRAIQPGWDGKFARVVKAMKKRMPTRPDPKGTSHIAQWQRPITPERLAMAGALLASLPQGLQRHAEEPWDAMLLWRALLGNSQADGANVGEANALARWQARLDSLSPPQKLALVQLSIPALKRLSEGQQQALLALCQAPRQENTLIHWCLVQLLRHCLAGDHGQSASPAKRQQASVQLLGLVAYHGNQSEGERRKAFYRGTNSLGAYQAQWRDSPGWQEVETALPLLRGAPLAEKARLRQALKLCIEHDGVVNEKEQVLHQCLLMMLDAE